MRRLQAIFSVIEPCEDFTDIGCDHGKVCNLVLQSGKAKSIVACDISLSSLQKAQVLMQQKAKYVHADGAKAIQACRDTVLISGLGGPEIVKILENADVKTLILQPQNRVGDVRRALNRLGYKIVKDFCVCERGKFYDIIVANKGEQSLSDMQYEWGAFCFDKDETLKEKLQLFKSNLLCFARTAENTKRLSMIEEVEKWQLQ